MEKERQCRVCGEVKPISVFGLSVSAGNGKKYRRHECRACTYKRQAGWREKNRSRIRKQSAVNTRRWRARLQENGKLSAYKEAARESAKQRRLQMRNEIYAAYGGFVCSCCGESQPEFLSIDHVNNDGYMMRKAGAHGSGALIYEWIKREHRRTGKWPDGFQILCMNCQHGKARNGGVCPHKCKEGVTTNVVQPSGWKRPGSPRRS